MKYICQLFLFFCIGIYSHQALAQKHKRPSSPAGAFGTSQWYVGLQFGTNHTQVNALMPYTEFVQLDNPDPKATQKNYYRRFRNNSQQLGLKAAFSPYKQVNISLSGLYFTYTYHYDNQFTWNDAEAPAKFLSLQYQHAHNLTYLEFPLVVRYYLLTSQKLKPYLLAGGYYGYKINAHKEVAESGIDGASGEQVAFAEPSYTTFMSSAYIPSQLGYLYGGGFAYRAGTLTLTLDMMYKQGLNNITNAQNRYVQTRQVLGFGNVQDDLKLNNLELSLSLLFPLKFLTKDFKPVTL